MYYSDTLQHHGILGMKWGIRRYQNKDGSLTAAGKARQNSSSDGNGSESKNMSTSSSSKSNVTTSSSSTTTKSVSEMTIAELNAITERNVAEANYYKSQKVLADAKSSNTTSTAKNKSKAAKLVSTFGDKTVESVINGVSSAIGSVANTKTRLFLEKELNTSNNKKEKG